MEAGSRLDRARKLGQTTHGLGALLILILVSLSVQLAAPDTDASRIVIVLLQSATLLLALWASGAHHRVLRAAEIAVAISIVTAMIGLLGGSDLAALPARVVTLLLIAIAPIVIGAGLVRDVRAERRVTIRTMFGVLCIYLLVGMLYSFGFSLIQEVSDEPFFAGGVEGEVSDFLYFSFSTITTTGYGDFTAGTDLGRSLSITEALVGQIYLVTVVALIVANIRPGRRTA